MNTMTHVDYPGAPVFTFNIEVFDGHLLKDHETDEASHIIVSDDISNGTIPEGANKVTVDWLWDSIKLKKKLSEKLYKPQTD
ncbi:hypothetical protein TNIN_112491 [Trichonephila inaurata madagascariensis]|uniref:DNA ligase 3 BRCT domain-containing protein n=1 Tax=Trichonephila inaurata madagascariensis TaxID=2747483 RepID=A0A8X6WMS4_9ARAC|nr:hypothetical protein TNIN_112491 [Trichonephila inaurata madagascariensis]